MLHAVVMAGGSGTRFWPASRTSRPKQLLNIQGQRTLIQDTVARCHPVPPERILVVTNADQAGETARQLPQIPDGHILIEPCARNTAPCIGLAAISLLHEDPDAIMLVTPADHVIGPPQAFSSAIERAAAIIEDEAADYVLFGVRPTYPASGFGYIERAEPLPGHADTFHVASFREKPDETTAREYLEAGRYYWNCGIFVWRARQILDALERFEPDMAARLRRLAAVIGTPEWNQAVETEFPHMRSVSIDYAVLERAERVAVVEAPFTWDDVGSWESLSRLIEQDEDGNTVDGLHCGLDTRNCIIRSEGGHLVATIGVEDCIIVQTPDATLVARRGDEAGLRALVAALKERGHEQFL